MTLPAGITKRRALIDSWFGLNTHSEEGDFK